ncbi:MAG: AEC family transporter [Defluviicoccus sp.]|nr:AEC family transporter [Defluviicoccus sp.]MDE0278519.1 AEC family transporter [Defluviicoccus sp.]
MTLIAELASIVAPVFICAAIGFLWAKRGLPFDNAVITTLVFNVGGPCLILATFAKVELGAGALAEIAAASVAAYFGFAAVGYAVLRAARLSLASYLPAVIFPLSGSMGLPVCLFAFGDEGLALALVFFVFGAVGTFTVGATIAAGSVSLARIARTPVFYAAILAVGLELAGIDLPRWAFNTAELLGGIVIPTLLVALGLALARLRVKSLGRSVALAALRLAAGAAIGWGVAEAFGLGPVASAVVILQSAMPVAVSSYLFAQMYGREPEEVAGMVLVSTLLSFATLPLLLALLLP